jgi:2'-5' RNA ligase
LFVIASLLDDKSDQTIREFWETLETECKLHGVKEKPIPHITWQIAENYHLEHLDTTLETISQITNPFDIHSNGLGFFTGNNLVLYLNLIVTKQLIDFHQLIWDRLYPFGNTLNMVYQPDEWIPHVTLAYKDLSGSNLSCAVQKLVDSDLKLSINIDNICVLYSTENQAGVHALYKLNII